MNKDWEKETEEIIIDFYLSGVIPTDKHFLIGGVTKKLLKLLAKQRTELLARVREAVKECVCDSTQHGHLFKDEILKKLEIISEEGKE